MNFSHYSKNSSKLSLDAGVLVDQETRARLCKIIWIFFILNSHSLHYKLKTCNGCLDFVYMSVVCIRMLQHFYHFLNLFCFTPIFIYVFVGARCFHFF